MTTVVPISALRTLLLLRSPGLASAEGEPSQAEQSSRRAVDRERGQGVSVEVAGQEPQRKVSADTGHQAAGGDVAGEARGFGSGQLWGFEQARGENRRGGEQE